MVITPNLGLTVWNLNTDPYDHAQLADNWARVDEHDHTPGKGLPITGDAIAPSTITGDKLDSGLVLPGSSIGTTQLQDGAVTPDKLSSAVDDELGLNSTGMARRGNSIIPTTETVTTTGAWVTAPTSDEVTVELPNGGLILVGLWLEVKPSAASPNHKVGLFYQGATDPIEQVDAWIQSLDVLQNGDWSVVTTGGDATQAPSVLRVVDIEFSAMSSAPAPPTLSAAGMLYPLFGTAGSYTIQIKYWVDSGTMKTGERNLWVWTVGF